MKSIYRLTLDSVQRIEMLAESCSEAIENARREHRGTTVVKCFIGPSGYRDDPIYRKHGVQDFTDEIPPHGPVDERAIRPKPSRGKLPDATAPMFDDKEIAAKTANALARFASA